MTAAAGGPGGTDDEATFHIVDEQTVWKGWRIEAATVRIEGPDGQRLEREVIHHPGAVAVVPLHDDGTVTLVRQYRVALDADVWEIPAGLRDVAGEPPEQTAQRELIEEAGLSATRIEHLISFTNSPGFSDEVVVIYMGTGLSAVPDDRQGPEEQHMVVDRIPVADALAMVDDGRIGDAKTVIGLLVASRRM